MPDVIVLQPVESTGDRSKPGAAFRIDVDRTVVRGRKTFASRVSFERPVPKPFNASRTTVPKCTVMIFIDCRNLGTLVSAGLVEGCNP